MNHRCSVTIKKSRRAAANFRREIYKMNLFTPLTSANYCDYFYVFMVIDYVIFIFGVLMLVMNLFRKNSKTGEFVALIYFSVLYFIMYFQSRLLYSMCSGNIQPAKGEMPTTMAAALGGGMGGPMQPAVDGFMAMRQ